MMAFSQAVILQARVGTGLRRRAVGLAAIVVCAAAMLAVVEPAGAATKGIWVSVAELKRLKTKGPAWTALKSAADGRLGNAKIRDQNSNHDVRTLAAALVYARTGKTSYRAKVVEAIDEVIGTEEGGRVLALGRNLVSYVIAADLIDLARADPVLETRFRAWLAEVRTEELKDDRTLVSTHETRPNNWGTHAGASRIAADVYLGDKADLARAASVFKGYLGDRGAYAGFDYGGDLSWQADPDNPVGVNPPGAKRDGVSIDGALPDEMRRGASYRMPPARTGYPWEALQGAIVQAQLLSRAGYDAWSWQDQAIRRAVQYLYDLHRRYGNWWAAGDDLFMPWIVNAAYGTTFPTSRPARTGKNMGWTDWTHSRRPTSG
jgi:hypothetical protein